VERKSGRDTAAQQTAKYKTIFSILLLYSKYSLW